MLATVPSCGATIGFSIFIASRIKIVSPFFTEAPTLASTLNTLPATGASTLTLPAPPAALGALLSHEALHQDEYNSLSEETFAWTMEAVVWIDLVAIYPESNVETHPLVKRENTLKKLFEKGHNSAQYIKKAVYNNKGYKDLPLTSPGFNERF